MVSKIGRVSNSVSIFFNSLSRNQLVGLLAVGCLALIALIYKRSDIFKSLGGRVQPEKPVGEADKKKGNGLTVEIVADYPILAPLLGQETTLSPKREIKDLFKISINLHDKKQLVYDEFTKGRTDLLNQPISMRKTSLTADEFAALKKMKLFSLKQPEINRISGPFTWEASDATTSHWAADFADRKFLSFCQGARLAQEEGVAVEHPQLYHLYELIQKAPYDDLKTIKPDQEAILMQGVLRMGVIDTQTKVNDQGSLYGNNFASAADDEITKSVVRIQEPTRSNIFAIVAPLIKAILKNKPYSLLHLEHIFRASCTAFRAIKQDSPGKVVIHTGNWGTGAFGNSLVVVYLLQMAAARLAGIDELRIYPMDEKSAQQFTVAQALFTQLEEKNQRKEMSDTVESFLTHLKDHAEQYGLFYGEGNKT
jgi:hypothetical protein